MIDFAIASKATNAADWNARLSEVTITFAQPAWEFAGNAKFDPSIVISDSPEFAEWIGDAAAAVGGIWDSDKVTARRQWGSKNTYEACRREDVNDESMLSPILTLGDAKHAVATIITLQPRDGIACYICRVSDNGYRVWW